MINTKLKAERGGLGNAMVTLKNVDGETVATFSSDAFFYVVTGFKTIEAYNEYQEEQPVKFLVWKREH